MEDLKKVDLNNLVMELESQQLRKRDLVVPSNSMIMTEGKLAILFGESRDFFSLTDNCHNQIANKLDIPVKYYERMQSEAVNMLDYNVNGWLERKQSNYLVRTFTNDESNSGIARAFLSDRFKVIDHLDILITALEAIRQSGQEVKIESADLTDKKMYVRFTAPNIVKDAPELLKDYKVPNGKGNNGNTGICTGFVLSNSETGHATFTIASRLTILACTNGMIRNEDKIAQRHLGGKMDIGDINWSEETKQKELELIQAQVKDSVISFLSEEYLGKIIADITGKGTKILDHPIDAVSNIGTFLNFSEDKKSNLLNYFAQSGDVSNFGAVQAVTFLANEEQPDLRYELESVACDLLDNMPRFDKPIKQYSKN